MAGPLYVERLPAVVWIPRWYGHALITLDIEWSRNSAIPRQDPGVPAFCQEAARHLLSAPGRPTSPLRDLRSAERSGERC